MTEETENLVLDILKNMKVHFRRMEDRFAGFEVQLNGFKAILRTLRIDMSTMRQTLEGKLDS